MEKRAVTIICMRLQLSREGREEECGRIRLRATGDRKNCTS